MAIPLMQRVYVSKGKSYKDLSFEEDFQSLSFEADTKKLFFFPREM